MLAGWVLLAGLAVLAVLAMLTVWLARFRAGAGESRHQTPVVAELAFERGNVLREVERLRLRVSGLGHANQGELPAVPVSGDDVEAWPGRITPGHRSTGSPFGH